MSRSNDELPALTHVAPDGSARMVDVADKPTTRRVASAYARVRTTPEVAAIVARGDAPKGDIIATCRLAGIQAAKRTAELVPLAHQVPLSSVDVEIDIDVELGFINVSANACTAAQTGIEIEAMVAASIASVTCYDMIKAIDRSAVIEHVRVVEKRGGRSGDFRLDEQLDQLVPIESARNL
jgi:cyclic pyranopterin phosphate synthase